MKEIKVIKIPPQYGKSECVLMENTHEARNKAVGGQFEEEPQVQLNAINLTLLCNGEALYHGLEPNENLLPFFYLGTCLIVATDGENFVDMTDNQLAWAWDWLNGLSEMWSRELGEVWGCDDTSINRFY